MMESYGFLLALQAYEDVSGSITASLDASVTLKHPTHQGSLRQLSVLMAALSLLEGVTGKPAQAYSATATTHAAEALTIDPPTDAWTVAAPTRVAPVAAAIVPEPLPTTPLPEPIAIAPILPELPTIAGDRVVQTTNTAPIGEPIGDPPSVVGVEPTQTIKVSPSFLTSAAALPALVSAHRSPPETLPAVEAATDRAPAATALRAPACTPTPLAAPAPLLLAQIVPDKTLPVNSQVGNCGAACKVINSGTVRGANLFHSFQQFSIPTGGEAYFNNAAQIQTILTRVTGTSLSNIDGLIRANGIANLYLLNPNGIVFGPHASLNIGGSFVATTAGGLKLPDGSEYSALNPQAPPLLAVNLAPGVQYGTTPAGSIVSNRGNLTAGQDLTLVADQLDLQGQLVAGKDLTLKAQQTLQARDSATTPLIVKAGRDLLVQGNQTVDIFALNHPDSGLFAGGNLVLRSANTVGGDAHYFAGGSLRIEQLDGSLGNLSSPDDPVIRASGDVSFDRYSGASLHILAGGSVTVTGGILIFDADGQDGLVETVRLSNGSQLAINGKTQPTLDIRAGLSAAAIGLPGSTPNPPGTNPNPPGITGTPTSNAKITIGTTNDNGDFLTGRIRNDGGLVFLSNQSLSGGDIQVGSIDSGEVVIDARGDIKSTGLFQATRPGIIEGGFITASSTDRNITLLAGRSIIFSRPDSVRLTDGFSASFANSRVDGSFINAASNGGNAGNITLIAGDAIVLNGPIAVDTSSRNSDKGGNITIQTRSLTLTNGAQLTANTSGTGDAGNIKITANSVQFEGTRALSIDTDFSRRTVPSNETLQDLVASGAFSQVASGASGNGGNIDIETQSLRVAGGAQVSTVTNGRGSAGRVTITATQQAVFDGTGTARVNIGRGNGSAGFSISSNSLIFPYSGAFSSVRNTAVVNENVRNNLGSVTITTPLLQVTNGARITSSLSGVGNAGDVNLNATSIVLSGAGPNATVPGAVDDFSGGISVLQQKTGNGGSININTQTLQVSDGIVIAALTRGQGDAGRVTIHATDAASFDGSFVISEVQAGGMGNGGGINIATGALSLTNGAQFRASTSGQGNAGNVIVRDAQTVSLASNSSISTAANAGAIGQGGDVTIQTGLFSLNSDAQITASTASPGRAGNVAISTNGFEATSRGRVLTTTSSSGQAGNITIQVSDRFTLRGTGSNFNDLNDTGIYAGTTAGSIGDGGSIRIEAQPGTRPPIITRDGAKIAVNSDGSGKGGDIEITTPGRITLDNRAFLNATTISGKGGNITIDPDLVLLRRNSQISTSAGRNRGGGDGGNITITTGFLIAAPFENSDITANAYFGSGGNITINANAIFGFLNAPAGILNTPFSDIAASSTLGINGTIILNTLNLDPSQGLGELNLIPVDSSQLIAQSCATGKRQALNENKFALTGRSGIPASPEDVFRNGSVLTELGTPVTTETLASTPAAIAPSTSPHNLVEAQDLIIDPNGKAHLVAQVSNTTPASFQQPRVTCPDGSSTQRPN